MATSRRGQGQRARRGKGVAVAVFSAREVVAFREPFRPWDREFSDPGVALDEATSLETREPAVLRVSMAARAPQAGPWRGVVGDWLCEPGEATLRLPKPVWVYEGEEAESRSWSGAREWLEAWETCDDAGWMMHAAARAGVARRLLTRAACACARSSLPNVLAGESSPARAIEAAESWAERGGAAPDLRDVYAAAIDAAERASWMSDWSAAYAAYAAADAAACASPAVRRRRDDGYDDASSAAATAAGSFGYRESADEIGWGPARLEALRRLATTVRSSIPTLDVLRAAAGARR